MLAFMPHSSPVPLHAPAASDTMSLAILPSPAPIACAQLPVPARLPPSPAPSKRPKLSLNTTSIPSSVFGKASTSLRLETLSATSPTARNTFSNAHQRLNPRPRPQARQPRPTLAPLATSPVTPSPHSPQTPTQTSASTTSSTSSSSGLSAGEASSPPELVPYNLSYNVTSILSNTPLTRRRTGRMSCTQPKPIFPATKQVSFRTPLTEDINTSTYTMKHSDIESSTSTISTLDLSPPEKTLHSKEPREPVPEGKDDGMTRLNGSPQTGDKRESSDDEDSDTCPATPIAGRKKRHRQWVWTLDPVVTSRKDQEPTEPMIRDDDKNDDSP